MASNGATRPVFKKVLQLADLGIPEMTEEQREMVDRARLYETQSNMANPFFGEGKVHESRGDTQRQSCR